MAAQKNSEDRGKSKTGHAGLLQRSKVEAGGSTGFWNGKYFIFFSFLFLFSCAILSVSLDQILYWSLGLWGWVLLFWLISKRYILCFGSLLPLLAGVLIQFHVSSMHTKQEAVQKFFQDKKEISGIIVDVWSSKKWQKRATIELENREKVYAYIPSQHTSSLGRKVTFSEVSLKKWGLFQFSRGSIWEVKYSEYKIGEFQRWYGLLHIRNSIKDQITRLFPHPESALLNGILVGDDSLMDEDFTNLYRSIWLSHITVVSGSNIAAVLAILGLLLAKLSQYLKIIISLIWVGIYVLLVGVDPPVLRALVMGSISLVALAYGDRVDSFRILLFTAVVLTLSSPLSLIYDAGFQLSFLATLGILVSIRAFRKKGILLQALGVSIFAGIWTLPISIGTFWTFHLWSIPANILVGPTVQISMFLWGFAILADTINSSVWYALWYIPYFTLAWIHKVAEVLSALPMQIQFDPQLQSLFAFVIFGITSWFSLRYLHLPVVSDESWAPSDQWWSLHKHGDR